MIYPKFVSDVRQRDLPPANRHSADRTRIWASREPLLTRGGGLGYAPGIRIAQVGSGRQGGVADIVWISVGAVAGANARFALGRVIEGHAGERFPFGTLCVNVTGSLLIGIMLVLLTERLLVDPHWRLLLVVGFLGSYTTMSSYAWETLALAEGGSWAQAILYVIGTNTLCLGACAAGMVVARTVR